jgi:glucose dehydrogenase
VWFGDDPISPDYASSGYIGVLTQCRLNLCRATPGRHKWAAGIFARDVETGQVRWFYHAA